MSVEVMNEVHAMMNEVHDSIGLPITLLAAAAAVSLPAMSALSSMCHLGCKCSAAN